MSMIKEVLETIKNECIIDTTDCKECPFNISDSWHEYCIFMGDIPHEGTTPDCWELSKIKWDRINDKESEE